MCGQVVNQRCVVVGAVRIECGHGGARWSGECEESPLHKTRCTPALRARRRPTASETKCAGRWCACGAHVAWRGDAMGATARVLFVCFDLDFLFYFFIFFSASACSPRVVCGTAADQTDAHRVRSGRSCAVSKTAAVGDAALRWCGVCCAFFICFLFIFYLFFSLRPPGACCRRRCSPARQFRPAKPGKSACAALACVSRHELRVDCLRCCRAVRCFPRRSLFQLRSPTAPVAARSSRAPKPTWAVCPVCARVRCCERRCCSLRGCVSTRLLVFFLLCFLLCYYFFYRAAPARRPLLLRTTTSPPYKTR